MSFSTQDANVATDDLEILCGNDPMNKHTARRKRRRAKLRLYMGAPAVRPHRRKSGRTGQIKSKRTPAKGKPYSRVHPNPPWQSRVEWSAP